MGAHPHNTWITLTQAANKLALVPKQVYNLLVGGVVVARQASDGTQQVCAVCIEKLAKDKTALLQAVKDTRLLTLKQVTKYLGYKSAVILEAAKDGAINLIELPGEKDAWRLPAKDLKKTGDALLVYTIEQELKQRSQEQADNDLEQLRVEAGVTLWVALRKRRSKLDTLSLAYTRAIIIIAAGHQKALPASWLKDKDLQDAVELTKPLISGETYHLQLKKAIKDFFPRHLDPRKATTTELRDLLRKGLYSPSDIVRVLHIDELKTIYDHLEHLKGWVSAKHIEQLKQTPPAWLTELQDTTVLNNLERSLRYQNAVEQTQIQSHVVDISQEMLLSDKEVADLFGLQEKTVAQLSATQGPWTGRKLLWYTKNRPEWSHSEESAQKWLKKHTP